MDVTLKKCAKLVEKVLMKISTDSVGKSIPFGCHEMEIPKEVIEYIQNSKKRKTTVQ